MHIHIAVYSFRLDSQISWNIHSLFLCSFSSVTFMSFSCRYFSCTWAASNGNFSYRCFDSERDSANGMIYDVHKNFIYMFIHILQAYGIFLLLFEKFFLAIFLEFYRFYFSVQQTLWLQEMRKCANYIAFTLCLFT